MRPKAFDGDALGVSGFDGALPARATFGLQQSHPLDKQVAVHRVDVRIGARAVPPCGGRHSALVRPRRHSGDRQKKPPSWSNQGKTTQFEPPFLATGDVRLAFCCVAAVASWPENSPLAGVILLAALAPAAPPLREVCLSWSVLVGKPRGSTL